MLTGLVQYCEEPGFFKIASPSRWNVIIALPDMINELRMARDDELSLNHASEEVCSLTLNLTALLLMQQEVATQYTVGLGASASMYHVDTVRNPLTRNLGVKFNEIYEEVAQSFKDMIPAKDGGV
jgi:hypothetical protein